MKWNLEKLSWRYAAMIGIVTPESAGMTEAEVSADRERWSHLIESFRRRCVSWREGNRKAVGLTKGNGAQERLSQSLLVGL